MAKSLCPADLDIMHKDPLPQAMRIQLDSRRDMLTDRPGPVSNQPLKAVIVPSDNSVKFWEVDSPPMVTYGEGWTETKSLITETPSSSSASNTDSECKQCRKCDAAISRRGGPGKLEDSDDDQDPSRGDDPVNHLLSMTTVTPHERDFLLELSPRMTRGKPSVATSA